MADIRIAGRITGRVQGVGFRWFIQTEAERLALRGWVRNTPAGDVEFEAQGSPESIDEFQQRIRRGPPAARVSQVIALPPTPYELPDGFEIAR